MCLIGLALNAHPRWALVVAANRDEFYDRPTGGLDWWQPEPGRGAILAGRDLNAGGTWLGVSARGRVGMLTNVRDPKRHRLDAPSRGALVTEWLTSDESATPSWSRSSSCRSTAGPPRVFSSIAWVIRAMSRHFLAGVGGVQPASTSSGASSRKSCSFLAWSAARRCCSAARAR